jgi:hypothetical protein
VWVKEHAAAAESPHHTRFEGGRIDASRICRGSRMHWRGAFLRAPYSSGGDSDRFDVDASTGTQRWWLSSLATNDMSHRIPGP